jgi:hypothetical protein
MEDYVEGRNPEEIEKRFEHIQDTIHKSMKSSQGSNAHDSDDDGGIEKICNKRKSKMVSEKHMNVHQTIDHNRDDSDDGKIGSLKVNKRRIMKVNTNIN